ncbi:MAG: hypothetical protein H7343_02740 [Undibacterium sp.]|nr:hypothetical protein [Opitutaceae bacterium]
MKNSQTYLLVILACTTLGGAAFAWKQHQELIVLRAASLGADERSDLQKRLWAAEKRAKDLADQLAALRSRTGGADALAEAGDSADPENTNRADRRNRGGPGGPGGGFANVMAAMQKPEIQRLVATQQKAQLDARYAALFKSLNLTPAQLDKFKNLLVEHQTSMMDVMTAAREQGLNPRTDPKGFQALLAGTKAEIDASIKTAIGDSAYAQYKNFDQTAPQRSTTDQLTQRLSYSGTPLTADQSAAMFQILSQTAPQRTAATGGAVTTNAAVATTEVGGGGRGGMVFNLGGGGVGGGPSVASPITDATIAMAQGVLSAPQVDALKQLQAEQKAQQQIAQAVRQTMGGGNDAAPTPTTTKTKKKGGD